MPRYKLDISFTGKGTAQHHVFDLDEPDTGAIGTCEVGSKLDSKEQREAWKRFHSSDTL
ncbi:hypothetical protein SY89_02720 [Halolamina pelagica]|uniref:Uncharacterized protein n=1 Tax=Halolamina pelagica TaxID=699431 RepID=A0A0N8I0D0_9EURY|nr:hypothetical protein SY89_02720 [Halolamina pelagica]